MERIEDFVDERQKTWCLHCGRTLTESGASLDHVPSRALLVAPHPASLAAVTVCAPCNRSFSLDEEYLAAFLGCVLSGSADPSRQRNPHVAAILAHSPALRARIQASLVSDPPAPDAPATLVWTPDKARVHSVVVKNARGHVYFEWGEPKLEPPVEVWAAPLSGLSTTDRDSFERATSQVDFWPEIGSRMLTRLVTGQDLREGWVVVQPSVYRYSIAQQDGVAVRSVLHEYLATEVRWDS